jgi:hypothetical protein
MEASGLGAPPIPAGLHGLPQNLATFLGRYSLPAGFATFLAAFLPA